MAQQQQSGGGIGLGGALFITFLVLKLTGVIAWSWWWVTAPLWGGLAVFVGLFVAFAAIVVVLKVLAALCLGIFGLVRRSQRR